MFWRNLSPDGGGPPRGGLRWPSSATSAGLPGSSASSARRLGTTQLYDHQSNVTPAGAPLLVVDVWEHADYLQYRTKEADYFAALSNLWNWEDVDARLVRVQELDLALGDAACIEVAAELASPAAPP